jgi:transposase
MGHVSIDIDLDDVYYNLGNWEKKELAEWLEDDGYCVVPSNHDHEHYGNMLDDEWEATMSKLSKSRLQLTPEEEDLIKQIANRL